MTQMPYAPPRRSRGPLVVVVVLVLVLVALVTTALVLLMRRDDDSAARPATPQAVEFRRVLKAASGDCSTPSEGVACDAKGMRYTLGDVELDGSQVSEVRVAHRDGGADYWYVALTLDDEGGRAFAKLTGDLATKEPPTNQLAIVVGDEVVAAPTVNAAITANQVEISGGYDQQTAEALADKITG